VIRALVPIGTAVAVFALGNALASHDYLTAAAAGVLVIVGILLLAPTPPQETPRP